MIFNKYFIFLVLAIGCSHVEREHSVIKRDLLDGVSKGRIFSQEELTKSPDGLSPLCFKQWKKAMSLTEKELRDEISQKTFPNKKCLKEDQAILPSLSLVIYDESVSDQLSALVSYRGAVTYEIVGMKKNLNLLNEIQVVHAMTGAILFVEKFEEKKEQTNKLIQFVTLKYKTSFKAQKAKLTILFMHWMRKNTWPVEMLQQLDLIKQHPLSKFDNQIQELKLFVYRVHKKFDKYDEQMNKIKNQKIIPYFYYYYKSAFYYKKKDIIKTLSVLKMALGKTEDSAEIHRIKEAMDKVKKNEKHPFTYYLCLDVE